MDLGVVSYGEEARFSFGPCRPDIFIDISEVECSTSRDVSCSSLFPWSVATNELAVQSELHLQHSEHVHVKLQT